MSVLSSLHRYRQLLHTCDSGHRLDMAEVLTMEQLGSLLRMQADSGTHDATLAILSTGNVEYSVELVQLGPDTLSCSDCPQVLPGTTIGLRLDDSEESASYLFRAYVSDSHFDPQRQQWKLELALVGSPVMLKWSRGRAPSSNAVLRLERNLRAA